MKVYIVEDMNAGAELGYTLIRKEFDQGNLNVFWFSNRKHTCYIV